MAPPDPTSRGPAPSTPGPGKPAPRNPAHRHVWVDSSGGYRHPGLIMAWRRTPSGWEAQVAVVRQQAVLVHWVAAATLRPVTDDHWSPMRRSDGGRPGAQPPG